MYQALISLFLNRQNILPEKRSTPYYLLIPQPTAVITAHIKTSQLRIKIDHVSCPANLVVTWNRFWFQKSYMKSS